MVRKKVVKKVAKKRAVKKKSVEISSASDKNLSKEFIELQKVLTIQSMKIEKLTTQISGLLELFTSSAKALAKKEFGPGNSEEISKMNDKIDNIFTETQKMSQGVMENFKKTPEPMYSPTIDSSPVPPQNQSQMQVPNNQNQQMQVPNTQNQPQVQVPNNQNQQTQNNIPIESQQPTNNFQNQ